MQHSSHTEYCSMLQLRSQPRTLRIRTTTGSGRAPGYVQGMLNSRFLVSYHNPNAELEDECAQAGDPVPSLTVSVSGTIPSDNPTGGSIPPSIPVATGSQSQSIFFSAPGGFSSPSASNTDTTAGPASTGAANPDTSVPNASHTTVAAPGSSSSGSVLVTFSSDTNSGVLNPSAAPVSGSASGAASVLARGSQVALTVLIGVMGGFYLVGL